jgi:acyl-CoA synthetase (AMP-forming)/AMP-acid ligase II
VSTPAPEHPAPEHPATLWALVEWAAATRPDVVALEDERGRQITFDAFRGAAEALAAGLSGRGIGPGTTVSWQLPTAIDTLVLMAALARLGATQNPIIPILRHRDVGFIVGEARTDVFVVRSEFGGFDFEAMAREVTQGTSASVVVDALPSGDPATLPPPPARGDVPRWLYHTSGSTAQPKGVWHADTSVLHGMNGFVAGLEPTEADVMPIAFPVAHIGGVCMLGASLTTGMRLFLLESFDFRRSPFVMAARGATILGSALPFFQAFLAAQRQHGAERLFPRLRSCVNGGAPLPPGVHEQVRDELGGFGIVDSWGLTEFPVTTGGRLTDQPERVASTQGRPSPGVEIRVVALDGTEQPPGGEGELRVRGPQMFAGYADPALADGAFDKQGFFRTGDLGVVAADGFVTVTGRVKDIIIRNAENISAAEIQDLLHSHPLIEDVAVIGVPDPRTGERVCAVVRLVDGAAGLSLAEVRDFCIDAGLAAQKAPELLEVVDAIPRNAMGKIDKVALRERYRPRVTSEP